MGRRCDTPDMSNWPDNPYGFYDGPPYRGEPVSERHFDTQRDRDALDSWITREQPVDRWEYEEHWECEREGCPHPEDWKAHEVHIDEDAYGRDVEVSYCPFTEGADDLDDHDHKTLRYEEWPP